MTEEHARLIGADCSSHGAPDKKPALIFGMRPDTCGVLIAAGVLVYSLYVLWSYV